uniref:CLASP N-terminal domain-containing protein n=1 Tax=Globisporangium ultimum (strain ATCC 200006 / CBS 805.95 / DAOM BR144) TaxID=431595 RepID=K3W826_GLOUD
MERVVQQQTQQVLEKADVEWSDISTALDELAHAIESLEPHQPMRDVSRQLLSISNELGAQIVGFRSKLVGEVCGHIARIVKVMLRDFRDVANELLPSLANTAKGASGAVRQPGAKLFSVISEHVRYDLQMLQRIFVRSPQEKVRLLLLEQIALILSCWRKEEIAPYYNDVLNVIQRGLLDSPQQVRSFSRDVFCSFSAQWEERITELVDVPSAPSRDLLLKEKPHAVISLAIVKKYPELQKKLKRTDSSKAIAKQRSLYKKSASIETQEVEILVATPPEKKRLEQGKDISRSPPPFQRQLFQDNENEQQPRPRKSGLRPPSASKIDQLQSSSSRLTQPSSTGIPVPPASTRPEDAFRRSSCIEMKAEGSKIPPPSTKSPATRARSVTRPAVTSRSQDTAALESKRSTSLRRPQEGISSSMNSFKYDMKALQLPTYAISLKRPASVSNFQRPNLTMNSRYPALTMSFQH